MKNGYLERKNLIFFLPLIFVMGLLFFNASNEKFISVFLGFKYFLIYLLIAGLLLLKVLNMSEVEGYLSYQSGLLFVVINALVGLYLLKPTFVSHAWYGLNVQTLFLNYIVSNFSKTLVSGSVFALISRPWKNVKEKSKLALLIITIITWSYLVASLFYVLPITNTGVE